MSRQLIINEDNEILLVGFTKNDFDQYLYWLETTSYTGCVGYASWKLKDGSNIFYLDATDVKRSREESIEFLEDLFEDLEVIHQGDLVSI